MRHDSGSFNPAADHFKGTRGNSIANRNRNAGSIRASALESCTGSLGREVLGGGFQFAGFAGKLQDERRINPAGNSTLSTNEIHGNEHAASAHHPNPGPL